MSKELSCEQVRERHLADEYRAGRLAPDEADAYERHFFNCERCFRDLEFHDRVARDLEARGTALLVRTRNAADARRSVRELAERLRPRRWILTPAIAAVAVAVGLLFMLRQPADDARRVRELWVPAPHPYVPSELRGGPGFADFTRGMEDYVAGRYRDAAGWLRRSLEAEPASGETAFYLGVSLLLAGEAGKAERALDLAVRLAPASREARWYLAQAAIEAGHLAGAERELIRLAAEEGPYQREARDLLAQVAEARTAGRSTG
jgi:tetratricopeptide (TPR) repeat protein